MMNEMPDPGVDPQEHPPKNRIDRLLEAIELVENDCAEDARSILRVLIQENSDYEDAWLWMSVAVDSLDQAVICLDNVLRINPNNVNAASSLYRLRIAEFGDEHKRAQLRTYRDWAMVALGILIMGLLFAILISSSLEMLSAQIRSA